MQNIFITVTITVVSILTSISFSKSRLITSSDSLNNNIIFQEKFDQNKVEDWIIVDETDNIKSNWYLEKGYLIQDTDVESRGNLLGSMALYNKNSFNNYVLRANVVCTDDDYIGVIFKYDDEKNYHRFILSSQDQTIRYDKKVNGVTILISEIRNQEWHNCKFSVTLFVNSDSIHVYLDDSKTFSAINDDTASGKFGFVSIANLGSFFDDVTIYSQYQIRPQKEIFAIERGPYLQNLLGDSVTIMWRTSKRSNSIVEYYSDESNVVKVSNNDSTVLHEIKLKKLTPSIKYFYKVKSGNISSGWHSFATPGIDTNKFNFILYGDNQLNFLRHTEITERFKNYNFDFIINCGDVVQRGPRNDWDTEFFTPLKEIIGSKPIYCAIGNHDLNSLNYRLNFSTPATDHESFYSFKYSNCFFVFLDNPLAAYPEKTYFTDFKPGSVQYNWLEKQLSSKEAQEADWLFVISHVPVYVLDRQDIYPDCEKYLVPLFEKYNVDFSFSGHIHGYNRGKVNGVNYVVSAGGGGALNKTGTSRIKSNKKFKSTYNYSYITVQNKTIQIQTFNIKAELIDELRLKKQ